MSRESLLELMERVESDEEFRKHAMSLPPEQRKQFIDGAGYDVGPADLVHLRELVSVQEPSDEDLELVAAGGLATELGAAFGGTAGGAAIGYLAFVAVGALA